MEDEPSLARLGAVRGADVGFCQRSSIGDDAWRVYVHGKKAYDLLKVILPHLVGIKREEALSLLKKYRAKTSEPVRRPEKFVAFGGMK